MGIETFSNNAQTTLNGSINNSVTSITVTSATGFPSVAGQFYRIIIDGEIMLVTAGMGTTSWTVTRGVENTSAVSHSSGAFITSIVTASQLNTMQNTAVGALVFPFDVPPLVAHAKDDEFTGNSLDGKWTSPGTSAVSVTTDVASGWGTLSATTANHRAYFVRQNAPTGDFSIYALMMNKLAYGITDTRGSIFMARTANSTILTWGASATNSTQYQTGTVEWANYSESSDLGGYDGYYIGAGVSYDGSVIRFRMRWVSSSSTIFMDVSTNGVYWWPLQSRTGWSQPDRIGFGLFSNGSNTAAGEGVVLKYFRVTEP